MARREVARLAIIWAAAVAAATFAPIIGYPPVTTAGWVTLVLQAALFLGIIVWCLPVPAAAAASNASAASGTARALASAPDSLARLVRSACSRTRSIPRKRSWESDDSCFNLPNSRSTEARPR
jgi:hypothetical protein